MSNRFFYEREVTINEDLNKKPVGTMKDASRQISSRDSVRLLGPFLMMSAAFCFAVMSALIKCLDSGFQMWDIMVYRFGAGFLILFILFGGKGNIFKAHDLKLLIFRGMLGFSAFCALFTAIRHIPVSTVMVLYYSFPAFAAVFSVFINNERLHPMDMVWIALAFIGVSLLFEFNLRGDWLGRLMGVTAAVFAALVICVVKKLRDNNGPVAIYLYFCLTGVVLSFPMYIRSPEIPRGVSEWAIVLGIVVSALIGQLCMNAGLRYCRSWEGGIYMTSQVLFAMLIGVFFLHEALTGRLFFSAALIVASVTGLNLHSKKYRKKITKPETPI